MQTKCLPQGYNIQKPNYCVKQAHFSICSVMHTANVRTACAFCLRDCIKQQLEESVQTGTPPVNAAVEHIWSGREAMCRLNPSVQQTLDISSGQCIDTDTQADVLQTPLQVLCNT